VDIFKTNNTVFICEVPVSSTRSMRGIKYLRSSELAHEQRQSSRNRARAVGGARCAPGPQQVLHEYRDGGAVACELQRECPFGTRSRLAGYPGLTSWAKFVPPLRGCLDILPSASPTQPDNPQAGILYLLCSENNTAGLVTGERGRQLAEAAS